VNACGICATPAALKAAMPVRLDGQVQLNGDYGFPLLPALSYT
jgi:hypothetical protein